MIRQVVTIDGTPFDVGVEYIKRKARIPDGPNAGEAKRGDWIRDVYGTFYDYILAFDTSAGLTGADRFFTCTTALSRLLKHASSWNGCFQK